MIYVLVGSDLKKKNVYLKKLVSGNEPVFFSSSDITKESINNYTSSVSLFAGVLVVVIEDLIKQHPKVIIFYNFNYERELLLELGKKLDIPTTQWNGHKHEAIPNTDKWIYIVQYAAGAEGWNCIETDTIIFYSQNYSYKATVQAAGRIDRLNTTFKDLNYYYILSKSSIDMAIKKALDSKRSFNELDFSKLNLPREKNNASNRRGSDFASFSYF